MAKISVFIDFDSIHCVWGEIRWDNTTVIGGKQTTDHVTISASDANCKQAFFGIICRFLIILHGFGGFGGQIDSNFELSDTSAFRINAMYESLENHRDFYDGDRIGINPTARFELSPDTTLDLSYEYVDHERFIDRGIPTGANGEPVEAFEDILIISYSWCFIK